LTLTPHSCAAWSRPTGISVCAAARISEVPCDGSQATKPRAAGPEARLAERALGSWMRTGRARETSITSSGVLNKAGLAGATDLPLSSHLFLIARNPATQQLFPPYNSSLQHTTTPLATLTTGSREGVGFVNSIFLPNDGVSSAGWVCSRLERSADAIRCVGLGALDGDAADLIFARARERLTRACRRLGVAGYSWTCELRRRLGTRG
jgi:hypothetical protein